MLREVAVALLWAAALFRLVRSVQLRHSTPVRAITAALISIAVAGTVTLPSVADLIDDVAHTPNFAEAVKNVAIVSAAAFNVLMFFSITKTVGLTRRRVVRHLSVAAAVSLASVSLFLIGDPTGTYDDFTLRTAGLPWVAESRMVVTLYAGVVLASVTRLCFASPRGSIRSGRGFSLLGTGTAVMVLYCFTRLGFFISARVGHPNGALYGLGSVLATAGLTLIAVGVLITPIKEWLVSWRDIRRLDPLWQAVQRHEPSVAVPSSLGGATGRVEHRVVQIEDGLTLMVAKPPRRDPVVAAVKDLGPRALAAWVRHPDDAEATPSLDDLHPAPGQSHVAWVLQIAAAFREQERTGLATQSSDEVLR